MDQINVTTEIFEALKNISEEKKLSIDEFSSRILQEYIQSYPLSTPLVEVSPIVRFYNQCYQEKFSIPSDESTDEGLLTKVYQKLYQALQNDKDVKIMLKKCIAWYIFHHDNITQSGSKIPHRLNLLLKEDWLLKKSIEVTAGKNLDYIVRSGQSNVDLKAYAKAAKRGDLPGQEHTDLASIVEEILIRFYVVMEKYKPSPKIKTHPKIKKLFESELPSIEYINEARKFIERFEEN